MRIKRYLGLFLVALVSVFALGLSRQDVRANSKEIVITAKSKYEANHDIKIEKGSINEHLIFENNNNVIDIEYNADGRLNNIFNNSNGEIRLYSGSITIKVLESNEYLISKVEMLNNPASLSIDGVSGNSATFEEPKQQTTIEHTASSGRSDIHSIKITIVEVSSNINASVKQLIGPENEISIPDIAAEFGQNVVVPVENQGTDLFRFALVNGVIRNDFVIGDNTLPITEGLDVSLVYATEETHAVLFLDSNGKLISNTWVDNGENVTAPATTELSKPGYKLSETPWLSNEGDTSLENITSSRVYRLQYELEETSKVKITVGDSTTEYNYNDIVTLTSTNPEFRAWVDEKGNVLSTKETFKFTALVDRTIKESDAVPTTLPVVTMTNDLMLRDTHQTFLVQLELREGDTLVEYGLVASEDVLLSQDQLTLDNADKLSSKVLVPATNEFMLSIPNNYVVVRAFVTARNANNEIETFYSDNQYKDVAFVMLAQEDLTIDSVATIDGLELPLSGLHNTTITWISNNPAVITNDGDVTLPEEETTVTMTATIRLGSVELNKEFEVAVHPEGQVIEPVILKHSDFGLTDGWAAYSLQEDKDIIEVPSGTSPWDILGGNVNNSGWDHIRMGGKNASSEASPNVYLQTKFAFSGQITKIDINIKSLDSASGSEKIYIQTSLDGETWTTVTNKETRVGDLSFEDLNIDAGNYLRFLFERKSTGSNEGTDVKSIIFTGIPN